MPLQNLEKMFYPRSVVVVGATNRDGAAGNVVMHNLLHGGFEGPIMPVTESERAIAGVLAYPEIGRLPITPDLAVVCGRQPALPALIRELGERGTRAAILLAENLSAPHNGGGLLNATVQTEARRCGVRLLGPDCLGVMVPGIGLNATIAHAGALPGGVGFVSQSSTMGTAVLDWARERDIGFSYFVSLGNGTDVDIADIVDYLGNDAMTRAIVLYVEEIKCGRSFMSAGRGASRNKPVLVVKSGRTPEGRRTAFGDERASGSDAVYDAAIRRAGMLRVHGFGELFAAVETLGRTKPLKAERLALLANGRGIAALAVDALLLDGGNLATLSAETVAALANHLPKGWPCTNPVVLDGEAAPERYGEAAKALLSDPQVDALMVVHAPVFSMSSTGAAQAIIKAVKEKRGAVLTSWMGGQRVAEARRLFADAGIPTYETPTLAVQAFMHMVRFRRNREILMETPASTPAGFTPATEAARLMIEEILGRGERSLSRRETKAILSAYGIATAEARIAKDPPEAAAIATKMGFPVALKIQSPEIAHRGEVGGVDLFLNSPDSVRKAAESMLERVRDRKPGAFVQGFIIERMVLRPGAQEVMIRMTVDPVFGPVIIFGHGGPASEIISDRAVALPPLNMSLARELVNRTRVAKLLTGYGDCPPADIDALCLVLVQVSQMIIDLPEIVSLDINPLFVDANGVFAVEAAIQVAPAAENADSRLAIRPYPKDVEEVFTLANGRQVLLRPIRPEDEPAHYEFLSKVTPEDIRLRFFHHVRRIPHAEMARLTQIDYDREMAIIVTAPSPTDPATAETLGVVRIVADGTPESAEYAILIRSDLKGQGLGRKLMDKIIAYCGARGFKQITGLVLCDNRRMLDMVHSLGFTSRRVPDDDVMEVTYVFPQSAGAATPQAA